MATKQQQKSNVIAIIAMFFLFAMISFVTNLAAPIGTIWGYKFEGNSMLGMMGNMMNFLAYLFMGIPAGNLLVKIGYKKTALWAMAIGVIGLFVQWLSSAVGADTNLFEMTSMVKENGVEVAKTFVVPLNFIIYLLGAFICGFCVCMLNTVVNPMLNLLGGGGNRGNQLVQMGGTLNSLAGTCTPFAVGALVGVITKSTTVASVSPLLWTAMGVFVAAFIVISMVKIPEPHMAKKGVKKVNYTHSAWSFRHLVLGVIGIFLYVGIEIGIPGMLIFYLQDVTGSLAVGTAVASFYWLLMLVGRFCSSLISGFVSSRAQIIFVSSFATLLIVIAIFLPKDLGMKAPGFMYDPVSTTESMLKDKNVDENVVAEIIKLESPTEETLVVYAEDLKKAEVEPQAVIKSLETPVIPYSAFLLVLCGLCTSVMWGGIFNLAVEGLGKYTAQASGIFMMMVVGGGVMPLIQEAIGRAAGDYMTSYWLVVAMMLYILYYALIGSKNVNTDIPVDEENVSEEVENAL